MSTPAISDAQLHRAASKIQVRGARYPEHLQKMVDR